jgi:PAS domain S-box-containing protein
MSALKEFANFITLNMANLVATYDRLLLEKNGDYATLPTDSRIAQARRLIKTVAEACESGASDPLYHLLGSRTSLLLPNPARNELPQSLIEVECLGQTLNPVVTNLEAGKFLWQMLAEARSVILYETKPLSPPPTPRPADKGKQNSPRDSAEYPQVGQGLRINQERFQQIVNSISDHIYVTEVAKDGQLINLYLSPHVTALTGFPLQTFLDDWSFWPSLIHPDDRAIAAEQAARLAKGQNSSLEYRLKRVSGDFIWVRDSGQVSKDANGNFTIYGLVSDITERKQAEEQLIRERNLLRTFMDTLPDNMYVKDTEGHILLANQASARHLGMTVDELIGKTDYDFFPPDLAAQYFADEQALLKSGQALINHEVRVFDQEAGTEKWLWITKVPFQDSHGEVAGLIGLNRDISGLKQTEEALRENQQLLQNLIDNSDAIIFVKDLEGHYVLVNKQFETLFHFDRQDVVGKTDYDVFPPEVAEELRANDRKIVEGKVPVLAEESAMFDDGPRTYLSIKFPLFDSAGVLYAVGGISTNITNRKQIEFEREQLLAASNRRIQREQIIREIFEKMQVAADLEQLVKITTTELGRHFSAQYAMIDLGIDASAEHSRQASNGHDQN